MNTQGTAISLTRFFLAIGLMVASVHLLMACESTSEPVGYVESDGVRRVTPEQAKMLVDQDKAVLVDTRSSLAFLGARAVGRDSGVGKLTSIRTGSVRWLTFPNTRNWSSTELDRMNGQAPVRRKG